MKTNYEPKPVTCINTAYVEELEESVVVLPHVQLVCSVR